MQISIQCPRCRAKLTAKDKLAGRELPCPKCGQAILVRPEPVDTTPPAEAALAELLPEGAAESAVDLDLGSIDLENADLGDFGLGGSNSSGLEHGSFSNAYAAPVIPVAKSPAKPQAAVGTSNRGLAIAAVAGGAGMLIVLACGLLGVALWHFTGAHDRVVAQNQPTSADVAVPVAVTKVAVETPAHSDERVAAVEPNVPEPNVPEPNVPEPNAAELNVPETNKAEPTPSVPAESAQIKAVIEQTAATPDNFADTLDRLKAATVFIKVTTRNSVQTGSGFLVEVANGQGVVVTNAHVITLNRPFGKTLIKCVFHSGTRDEFEATASVSAKDDGSDLAILTVKHDSLPAPIDSATDVQLRETTPVIVLGFPFGESLTTNSRNPSISVSKGSISSIRRDDYDNVALLQIDGGINPGNSGGPMVTEGGSLVGISVAKVRDANIGFAIPKRVLADALAGGVARIAVRETGRTSNERTFQIRVEFIDPKQNITNAELVTFDVANQNIQRPDPDGYWKIATDRIEISQQLSISGTTASTQLTMPLNITRAMFQIHWSRNDGTQGATSPLKFEVDQARPMAASADTPRAMPRQPAPEVDEVIGSGQVVLLANTMADFALNPRTGDIAAVAPLSNRAYLFREHLLEAANTDAAPDVPLGETPVSITYKQFGDVEVYAVVCSQDSHMYVIDANEFTLVRKIPLSRAGLSNVTASSNAEDPFVYYNYGSGHGSAAGAVDLRKMVDRGPIFDGAMVSAISADGRVAYRHGPWSPSGFESLLMTNSFADDIPKFVRLWYEHRSEGAYLPDPFGEYTVSHWTVYTKDLEKQVASLKFVPSCFFRTKPILVGLRKSNLCAASYNTFSSVGATVQLPKDFGGVTTSLQREIESQAERKQFRLKERVLADDKNSRVIYAVRNKLAIVPLTDFELPEEPFMVLDVSSTELTVGTNTTIQVAPRDPRVTIEYGDLPVGMTKTKNGLKWTPRDENVGPSVVPVTLSFADIRRDLNLELRVAQPCIESPIDFGGFLIDENATQAVCWAGPPVDGYGRSIVGDASTAAQEMSIAIVPLRAGSEVKKHRLPFVVKQAVAIGSQVAILPATDDSRVEIYDTNTMERVKTLLALSPLTGISTKKDQLILQGSTSVEVYDLRTFERLRTLGSAANTGSDANRSVASSLVVKDGVIVEGVLYDALGETPKLIIAPNKLPVLNGADVRLYSGSFLRRQQEPRQPESPRPPGKGQSTSIVAGPVPIISRSIRVSLEHALTQTLPPGSQHTLRVKREIALVIDDAAGARRARVPIVNETVVATSRSKDQPSSLPRMQVVDDQVFVAVGRSIYRWSAQSYKAVETSKGGDAVEFHVVPEQSTFATDLDKTELTHTLKGGQAPYEYFLLTRWEGVTLDNRTGVATIDREKVLVEAVSVLKKYAADATDVLDATQKLQAAAIDFFEAAVKLFGHKPKGVPLAIPIHFKAIDDQGKVAEMQYFVLLDVPYRQAAVMLNAHLREFETK